MVNRSRNVVRIIVNLLALIAFIINVASRILAQAGIGCGAIHKNLQYGKSDFDDAGPNSHIASLAMVQELTANVQALMF